MPISIAALAGVQASEAGLASGLINTSQQIGGALGIAVLSTIATTQTDDAVATRHRRCRTRSWTGSRLAFLAGVAIAAVGVLVAPRLIRRDELEQSTRGGGRSSRPAAGAGRLERREQLEELRGAVDHDVGGLAELAAAPSAEATATRTPSSRPSRARNASRSVVSSPA